MSSKARWMWSALFFLVLGVWTLKNPQKPSERYPSSSSSRTTRSESLTSLAPSKNSPAALASQNLPSAGAPSAVQTSSLLSSPPSSPPAGGRRLPDRVRMLAQSRPRVNLNQRRLALFPSVRIVNSERNNYSLVKALAYSDQNLLQINESEILLRKFGYTFVAQETPELAFSTEFKPVVQNGNTGRLGIVTGTFLVQFKDQLQAEAFAQTHQLQLMSSDPTIKMAFYQPQSEGVNLLILLRSLREDPTAEKVSLEIIESLRKISP